VTRVFVAAPTLALRLRLRAHLEGPGLSVVGDGPTAERAPAEAEVVVLAGPVRLATGGGRGPALPRAVVVLADDERPLRALRGLPLRGWAVVAPDAPGPELRAAVAAAAEGLTALPAALAARLLAPDPGHPEDAPGNGGEPLTAREREVLELLGEGLSNRRIAERLGISEHTAKFHVASVCGKLGAASRTEAVGRGVRLGLITL
jgi:DNA-binding NarL/FixJ family response regulator